MTISCMSKSENPGSVLDFRDFLFRLCKVAYTFRLLLPVASVQPFANVVANYTCRNRSKKCDNYFMHKTSPPFCWRFGSSNSIPQLFILYYMYFLIKSKKSHFVDLRYFIKHYSRFLFQHRNRKNFPPQNYKYAAAIVLCINSTFPVSISYMAPTTLRPISSSI